MTQKDKILETLSLLGLSSKQSGLYLACLELGTSQVGDVVKKTGEKRTTVYASLQELVRQGLLKAIKSGNKYLFTPEPPEVILEQYEERKEKIAKNLPFLQELFLQESVEPKLKIFNGRQIARLFEKMLGSRDKDLFMIRSNAPKSEVIGKEFHFGSNRRENKIFAKVLLSRDSIKLKNDREYFRNQKERLREVRLLPNDISVSSDIFVFDSSVCIISPDDKMGFAIDNKNFADLMKNIFNLLWGVSKPTYSID